MAAFVAKLLLFLASFVTVKAQDNFGIVEPFPENIYPIEGTAAEVTCVAFDSSGVRTPERIQFMRKDQYAQYTNITASDNIYFESKIVIVQDEDGNKTRLSVTMGIRNVTQSDDSQFGPRGRYECHAFAVGVPVEKKHGFSVNVITKAEIPTVNVPKISVLKHGVNVTITCNLTEGQQVTRTGLKRISWFKDRKLQQSVRNPDPKKPQDTLGPLRITNVKVTDGGNYTCLLQVLLRNVKPHNVSDSAMIKIAAWLTKHKEDPEIKKYKGDTVSFECPAKGFPLEVEWKVKKKGEDTVKSCINASDGNYRIIRRGIYEPYFLNVSDLKYSDRGSYYCCLPSNCSDSVEGDCQRFVLRVRDPLGPLWPAIGIIVEAILLFLVIFISEKRKKSREKADKQDGRVEFSFSSTDDGDRGQVRLRKAGEGAVA